MMPGCNCFVSRKLIPWDRFPRGVWSEEREGLGSYIHHYEKKYPGEHFKFNELATTLAGKGVLLQNYGAESPHGKVDDLSLMCRSVATVHIKGGNAVCNAVVRSMAVGTPVLMDRWTHVRCFFDKIEGIIVTDDLAGEVKRLVTDEDYLEEMIDKTMSFARRQFSWDEGFGEEFRMFIGRLK
jgi:hypothetical protein